MLFNSFEFLVFLPVTFLVYWFLLGKTRRGQNLFLLIASYVFYCWWDWRFGFLLLWSSLIDYVVSRRIQHEKDDRRRRFFLYISLVTNLGLLAAFKYFNFFSTSFSEAASSLGWEVDPFTLNVVLPVGISFYTFQTLSYTIDVYRRQLTASRDLIAFSAYVSFFPQLVAGPIERAVNLLPQFQKNRLFTFDQAASGLRLILWGLFKKIVIADNCATFVNQVFDNYQSASGLELILGAVFFAFQIYGDFSGYSDIAIGVSKLFGFELMINFKTPYFSRDIAEFWRRWHISLSTWFRDYLYFPLGGSKVGTVLIIRNTMIVFLVSGFWHGANWTFIAWGALNGIYFLPLLLSRRNRTHLDTVARGRRFPSARETLQIFLTFTLTCFAWIFFRSPSISHASHYIERLFTAEYSLAALYSIKFYFPIILCYWLLVDWIIREEGITNFANPVTKPILAYCFDVSIIAMIVLFGSFNEQTFIYFQF